MRLWGGRFNEVNDPRVADFTRSVILNQVENGIAVRMAVLEKVIG